MTDKNPETFHVLDVNLEGKNLIEAAAGTGKTYSIAIMVLRWIVMKKTPIDSILAVTFTNYATAELKERILEFLEKALSFLEKGNCDDKTIRKVCEKIPENEKDEAVKNLKKAVNDFDTASIFTIHGFCQKLIREHAFELGIDFKMELSQDTDPANDAAAVFFRKNIADFGKLDENGTNLLENKAFRENVTKEKLRDFISKAGIGIKTENIKIATGTVDAVTAEAISDIYKDFSDQAPRIAKENRENKNIMGFDDILLIIYEVLQEGGEAAQLLKKIMEERYSFVLIDEFQDTDPLQYSIFKNLFCNGKHTVFFIGDPKQSIYAFRKADIFAYREARENVKVYNMEQNFRSAHAAVEAANEVFDTENIFGDDELIKYQRVTAAKNDDKFCLLKNGEPFPYGLLVRQLETLRNQADLKNMICTLVSQAIQKMIKKDSSFKIREEIKNKDGTTKVKERAVKFSDIAILTAKNDFALEICEKLKSAGINAAVEADTAKQLCIFLTEEACVMQKLLSAAVTKGFAEFKALLLTFFYGKTVTDIAQGDKSLTRMHDKFIADFSEWNKKGFYFAFSRFLENKNVISNIAKRKERTVTILRQLAELIHKHEEAEGFSPLYTQRWFGEKIEKSKRGGSNFPEEESIRAENDRNECVRIMTLHKSKGLEFNIVFFPFILNRETKAKWVFRHKKKENGYEREMIFTVPKEAEETSEGELPNDDKLEETRRIYVGITRAKYLTVCYTYEKKGHLEPTSFFSHGDQLHINFQKTKPDNCTDSRFDAGKAAENGTELTGKPEEAEKVTPGWAMTSFSGITANERKDGGFPDDSYKDPESDEDSEESAARGKNDKTVPMALFPSGTDAGTVLHSIFEEADFSSDDNTGIIRTILKKKMNFKEEELEKTVDTVNKCLNCVFTAPVFDGKNLRAVEEKTHEMKFFLSIENDIKKGRLSKIIEEKYGTAPIDDDSVTKGFLNGAIDLAAKIGGKYYIIDWKSNNLKVRDDSDDPYSAYNAEGLEKEMKKHKYYLQYMIYLAAFDKYMTTADPEYSYEKSFGGIRYVFMRGVQAGRSDTGIFSDRPEESELRKIQELFDGEEK